LAKFSHHVAGAAAIACRKHGGHTITVTVTHKHGGAPFKGAAVRLMLAPPAPPPSTPVAPPAYSAVQKTGAQGTAVFAHVAGGRYSAEATHPSWWFVPAHVEKNASDHLELVAVPKRVIWGCDTNQANLDLTRAKAHPQPCSFIGRYLSRDQTGDPPLLPAEAPRYGAAGLDLVALWEYDKLRAKETDPATETVNGAADATAALAALAAIGAGTQVVYFTADFTISTHEWLGRDGARIRAYFEGVKTMMPVAQIGAYGTYATLVGLLDVPLISHAWQMTFGAKGNQIDSRVGIYQYDIFPSQVGWLPTTYAGGLDMDVAVTPHFGQFRL
jgi:hypothetical protein